MNVYIGTSGELKNAYIGEYIPRQPWANTIAYYPLESDGNDYSGNWHNLTWNSTPSYWVSWWTKSVVNLWGNKLWRITNLSWTFTNYTFNVWCKISWTGTWQEIFDCYNWNGSVVANSAYFGYNSSEVSQSDFFYQRRPWGWTANYGKVYWTSNRSTNTWYNVCLTSTSSWIKIFLNWTEIANGNTTWAIVAESWHNSLWWRYDNSTSPAQNKNFFNWYLSEFIFENKTWTATEVLNYYNWIKSNYWL